MSRQREYSILPSPAPSCVSSVAESTEPFTFVDKVSRESACLRGFRGLYEGALLFDVVLRVDGQEFQCHRALLAASSDYFRAMFTDDMAEKDLKVIPINGVDATSMEQVIKYLYAGEAKLHSDTVQNLLSAANMFQLLDLRDGCADFMAGQLDIDNSIGVFFFARAHQCHKLEELAKETIIEQFDEVCTTNEFLELPAQHLIEILKYDDLLISEEDLYEAINSWFQHEPAGRRHHLYNIMQHVRFMLIDEHFFYDHIKNNQYLKGCVELQDMFEEIIRYKLLGGRWMECDLKLEPRYGSSICRLVVYTSYFDDEKKQVLQLYGPRSDEATSRNGNILCDLPSDIENPAVLVTGENDLYVAGGEGCAAAIYKWSHEDNSFEDMTPLATPRKQFCLVQLDRHIYIVGGCNHEGNLNSVMRYCETECELFEVASLPRALRCFCAVAFKGKLYVFGGESEKINKKVARGKKEISKHTLCYNPRKDKWSHMSDMRTPRALAGCTIYNNKIYVVGGFSAITDSWIKDKSPEHCLQSVEVYDPETNTWESGPDLPLPLCGMGVVKYQGRVCILGGENDEDLYNHAYLLSVDGSSWEAREDMVTGVTETTIHSAYAVMNIDLDDGD